MIVGIGVDVCAIDRFAAAARRPGFLERVLHPDERAGSVASQAGRWAAKEALAKALGAPSGLAWLDCHVVRTPSGRPVVRASGTVAARMAELGVSAVHVSISHDAGIATAMVVCEGASTSSANGPCPEPVEDSASGPCPEPVEDSASGTE